MAKTLNPYRQSAGLLSRRISWDLDPRSFVHRRKVAALRDQYINQKCVILCNGPSLLDVNFDLLRDFYTIGLNKINLLYKNTDFRCSSICAVNPYVISQNASFYKNSETTLFLDAKAARKNKLLNCQHVYGIHTGVNGFAEDCSWSVSQGYTVTYFALQIAYHLGFKHVTLVGCDHKFSTKGVPNTTEKLLTHDVNHFDPEYFRNQFWQHPDLNGSERSYLHAKHVYEGNNRYLFNSSTKTELSLLPKLSLENFIML
ncbi:DUF115 domain-containing protein [Planktomarina temperata]|nr:DUF115 domain-containing protein [Planktomarina temperata]